jgi:hypothetical protein
MNGGRPEGDLRFLLCDTTGNVELSSPDGQWVSSPIQCLDKAVDRRPRIIVIRFGRMAIREREALVELSGVLKRNSHTRSCPVLALLHSKHRKLMEDLERAKVDHIRYVGDTRLDSIQVREIIEGLGPEDRLERHLEIVCPFLHYSKIDSQHEMAVCGAYLDRMVLGGRRLHELCETDDHLHCEYYLSPRPQS